MRPTNAAPRTAIDAFAGWLKKHDLTQATAASALGYSEATISNWLRGLQTPDPLAREKIEKWTCGTVKANVWRTPLERRELAGVHPYAA
jgi:transcriptional regulator with XRE-family HTH domain